MAATKVKEGLTYKGKPLLRSGNKIFYGNPEDKYIVYIQIQETTKIIDLEIGTEIVVQLQTNKAPGHEKVIKSAEREGLYEALDLGEFWLTEALEENA
ncbi:MAG: hypothetical protein PHE51_06705 [Eubacteriales bacterium]|nr:hypothetical protein [Eubacteriales bacterium]